MDMNLLSLAQSALGGDFAKQAAQFVGESPSAAQGALSALLPAVVGAIAQKGSTTDGASSLMSLINSSNLNAGTLTNIGGLFGGAGTGANDLLKIGTTQLVPALFGDKAGGLVNALSSASGIRPASATNLVALVVPMVLALLKKLIGERGLGASSLASLLGGQGQYLQGALDPRITSALGFASPGALLSGLGGAAADTARRAGAAVTGGAAAMGGAAYAAGSTAVDAGRSAFARYLPWIIGIVILALLWWMFSSRSTTDTTKVTTAPATAAPAATTAGSTGTPVMAFAGFPAKVYFETGSTTVGADGGKVVASAADEAKKGGFKVALTGYTDKTGDSAKNEEIAKNRALAVRDALKAAGMTDESIEMRPPVFVETGAGAGQVSDAEARRVEINKL
jgi:outer membrane protein OmpA-like peptidoglycan-associated protein